MLINSDVVLKMSDQQLGVKVKTQFCNWTPMTESPVTISQLTESQLGIKKTESLQLIKSVI